MKIICFLSESLKQYRLLVPSWSLSCEGKVLTETHFRKRPKSFAMPRSFAAVLESLRDHSKLRPRGAISFDVFLLSLSESAISVGGNGPHRRALHSAFPDYSVWSRARFASAFISTRCCRRLGIRRLPDGARSPLIAPPRAAAEGESRPSSIVLSLSPLLLDLSPLRLFLTTSHPFRSPSRKSL